MDAEHLGIEQCAVVDATASILAVKNRAHGYLYSECAQRLREVPYVVTGEVIRGVHQQTEPGNGDNSASNSRSALGFRMIKATLLRLFGLE